MLTESMEDYLEMIYRLEQEKGEIRLGDLASSLRVQPPSVTRMVQKLAEENLVTYEKYQNLTLTPLGREIGYFLIWRDRVLKEFLTLLTPKKGREVEIEAQVEGIEHYITPPTMCLFRDLLRYFRAYPGRLALFRESQPEPEYPDGQIFPELRAWGRHQG